MATGKIPTKFALSVFKSLLSESVLKLIMKLTKKIPNPSCLKVVYPSGIRTRSITLTHIHIIMRMELHKLKILKSKKNLFNQKSSNPIKYHASTRINLSKPQGINSHHYNSHKIPYA